MTLEEAGKLLRTELASSPNRWRQSVKTGIACVLGFFFAMYVRLDHPYWVLITILIVSLPSYGATVEKGVSRVVTTLLSLGLCLWMVANFIQEPLIFLLIYTIVGTLMAMAGRAGFYPAAIQMATAYFGFMAFAAVTDAESATQFFVDRCVDVIAGVAIAWLVNRLIWPVYAGRARPETFARLIREMSTLLRAQVPDPAPLLAAKKALAALLDRALWEERHRPEDRWGAMLVAAEDLMTSVLHFREAWDGIGDTGLTSILKSGLQDPLVELLKTLDALALELAAENWEPVWWDPDGVEHQIRAAFVAFRTAKEAGGTKEYGSGNVALTVAALEQVLQNLRRIESARTQKAAVSVAKHSAAWQIDWPLCIQSFKQPLCGIITGWLVLSWGWETPMPAVLSAVIVYQPTLGASYRRVIMRLAGAMIGAMMTLTAMIWILPNFQSAGVMAIVLGMVMTICAYLYFSSERYNYIGMQAGFVVAITLVTGYQITGDLDPMWSRLQGILLAGLVVALVSRWFFPVRSSAVLVKILRQWLAAIRTVSTEALNAASERKGISALRTAWGGMGRVDQLLVESAAESHAPIFRSRLLPDYARLLERLTVHLLAQPSPRADTSKLIDGFAAEPAIALRTACDTLLTEASNAVAGTPHRVQNATVALDAAAAGLRERMSELRENRSCMQSSDEAITAFFAWMQEAITMAARLRDLAGATCRLEAATRLISDVEKKAPMPAMQPASA